jgi:hypothetical protein
MIAIFFSVYFYGGVPKVTSLQDSGVAGKFITL